jgi:Uma2 family endonuclease
MPATALLTSDQYLALPDEFDKNGNHVKDELIGGEVVKVPPPSRIHDRIKNLISRILIRYFDARPQGSLDILVEIGFQVSDHDTFVPDVSIIACNRLAGEERIIPGAPEIAIEVVSPDDTARHLKSKVDAYLANGSQTVWIVFPDSRSVMVHTADSVRELKADQQIDDPLLPGFSTPVSSFFELT